MVLGSWLRVSVGRFFNTAVVDWVLCGRWSWRLNVLTVSIRLIFVHFLGRLDLWKGTLVFFHVLVRARIARYWLLCKRTAYYRRWLEWALSCRLCRLLGAGLDILGVLLGRNLILVGCQGVWQLALFGGIGVEPRYTISYSHQRLDAWCPFCKVKMCKSYSEEGSCCPTIGLQRAEATTTANWSCRRWGCCSWTCSL